VEQIGMDNVKKMDFLKRIIEFKKNGISKKWFFKTIDIICYRMLFRI
jgi:hypothetical protein